MVHDNLSDAQLRHKSHFDKRAKPRSLNVGDEVLLMLPTDNNKLTMRWKGPCVIKDKVGANDSYPDWKECTCVSCQHDQGDV